MVVTDQRKEPAVADAGRTPRFCTNCGAPLAAVAFCTRCGTRVPVAAPVAPQTEVSAEVFTAPSEDQLSVPGHDPADEPAFDETPTVDVATDETQTVDVATDETIAIPSSGHGDSLPEDHDEDSVEDVPQTDSADEVEDPAYMPESEAIEDGVEYGVEDGVDAGQLDQPAWEQPEAQPEAQPEQQQAWDEQPQQQQAWDPQPDQQSWDQQQAWHQYWQQWGSQPQQPQQHWDQQHWDQQPPQAQQQWAEQSWGQQPQAAGEQQPSTTPAGAGQSLDLSNLSWPIPATWLQFGSFRTLLEPAVTAGVLVLGGLALLYAGRGLFTIFKYLGDVPIRLFLPVLAMVATFLLVVVGLVKTGHWLLQMNPLGRAMTLLWAGLAFVLATVDGMPGWLYFAAFLLAVLGAAMYLSPAAKAAFAEREARATPPTPIGFSLVLIAAQMVVLAIYTVAFLPLLGDVSEMNTFGEWTDQGPLGTMFVLGLVLMVATLVGTYLAYAKIKARDVAGRIIMSIIAALGVVSFFLLGGALEESGVQSTVLLLGGLALWAAILVPLWWGHVPAKWFGVDPIGVSTTPPEQSQP